MSEMNYSTSVWPDWAYEKGNVIFVGWAVGFIAKEYRHNTTMTSVVLLLNDYYAQHNFNTSETFLLAGDIANLLGSHKNWVEQFWAKFAGPHDWTGIDTSRALVGGASVVLLDARINGIYQEQPGLHKALPVFVVLSITAAVFTAARIYSRVVKSGFRGIMASDWSMILGYILTSIMGIFIVIFSEVIEKWHGTGLDVQWSRLRLEQMYLSIIYLCYPIPILAIKTSWLLFYYNLTIWNPLRWACIATFVFILLTTIASFVTIYLANDPFDFWDNMIIWKVRFKPDVPYVITGALNVFSDVVIWVLPLPMVFRLSISRKERLICLATFGFGAIAAIFSIIRLIYIHQYFSGQVGNDSHLNDIKTFTIIEMYLAVIGGCIPAVKALVTRRINRNFENAAGLGENSLWTKFRLKSFSSGTGTLESQTENIETHHPIKYNVVGDFTGLAECNRA